MKPATAWRRVVDRMRCDPALRRFGLRAEELMPEHPSMELIDTAEHPVAPLCEDAEWAVAVTGPGALAFAVPRGAVPAVLAEQYARAVLPPGAAGAFRWEGYGPARARVTAYLDAHGHEELAALCEVYRVGGEAAWRAAVEVVGPRRG